MSKHTPGPWRAVFFDVLCADGAVVCTPKMPPSGHYSEALANARLLAAAPDLYDGCNALLGLLQLVCGRSDVPPEIKAILETSHRGREALAAVAQGDHAMTRVNAADVVPQVFTGYSWTRARWYAEARGVRSYYWTRREALDEAKRLAAVRP
jgi:hypothetical protein